MVQQAKSTPSSRREILTNLTLPFRSSNWSEPLLTSARGSRTYALVSREASLDSLSWRAGWAALAGVGAKHNREYAGRLTGVTVYDTAAAARKYLKDFENPDR